MDFDISLFFLYVAGIRAHGVLNLPGAAGQKVECRIETINVCTEKLILTSLHHFAHYSVTISGALTLFSRYIHTS